MAKHQRNRIDKQEEIDEKHNLSRKPNKSPYDQLKAPGEDAEPLAETPFRPQVGKHVALLAGARSDVQRTNLVLQLQRDYGNAYVQRLLKSRAVQAKLNVNPPDDAYEKEADRVAETVTKTSTSEVQRQPIVDEDETAMEKPASEVQRQADEEEEGPVMTKPASEVQRQPIVDEDETAMEKPASEVQRQADEEEDREEEEGPVMTKPAGNQPATVAEDIEAKINTERGGGRPLADSVRNSLEPQFERDFGDVRVHDSEEASKLSQQLGAEAFTTGKDIFFREGAYQPDTDSGKKLIAHELTHVVQQGGGNIQRQKGIPGAPEEPPKTTKDPKEILGKVLEGVMKTDTGKQVTKKLKKAATSDEGIAVLSTLAVPTLAIAFAEKMEVPQAVVDLVPKIAKVELGKDIEVAFQPIYKGKLGEKPKEWGGMVTLTIKRW